MVSIQRIEEIIKKFSSVKIAVIGDMMLDEYLIGKVNRISPEAPVPIVNIEKERFVLGGASNVANNLTSLEGKVFVYGVIGNDANGEKFVKELENKDVNSDGIVKDGTRPTIIKSRVLSQGQQLLRLDWEKDTDISEEIQNQLLENFEKNIENIDAVLLSDYNKGLLTKHLSKKVIEIAKKHNKRIMVDPKPQNFKNYVGATSMTPNRKEILDYFGMKKFTSEEEIAEKMEAGQLDFLHPLEIGTGDLVKVFLTQEEAAELRFGRFIELDQTEQELAAFEDDKLLAILEKRDNLYKPRKVFI